MLVLVLVVALFSHATLGSLSAWDVAEARRDCQAHCAHVHVHSTANRQCVQQCWNSFFADRRQAIVSAIREARHGAGIVDWNAVRTTMLLQHQQKQSHARLTKATSGWAVAPAFGLLAFLLLVLF